MRCALDWIYRASGSVAVLLLISIGALTLAQVVARLAGTIVPSADDFATFAMACAIFLGLAYTYRVGGHVRVRLLQQRLPAKVRRWTEAGCLGGAVMLLSFLLWYTVDMILTSYQLNEHTLGLVPLPKWIPMMFMPAGLLVLLLAMADDLAAVLRNGKPSYAEAEEAEDFRSSLADKN
jgi:TRAP-type C4-dicarboxylate transport system permease small subunit